MYNSSQRFFTNHKTPTDIKQSQEYGRLFVISGPSGVGKSSIIKGLLTTNENLKKLVSYTTRKIRLGETHGSTYFYISHDEFKKKLEKKEFLQHSEFDGNFYGYCKEGLLKDLTSGINVIADLDFTALSGLKQYFPDCITFFIEPPTYSALQNRLILRGDSPLSINNRLKTYTITLEQSNRYDFIIVNEENKLETTVEKINQVINQPTKINNFGNNSKF